MQRESVGGVQVQEAGGGLGLADCWRWVVREARGRGGCTEVERQAGEQGEQKVFEDGFAH